MAKAKEEAKEPKEAKSTDIKMVWRGKTLPEGTIENCFGFPGEANEDGLLVVTVPKGKAKGMMKRKPMGLMPLDVYEKRKKIEEDFAASMEDFD